MKAGEYYVGDLCYVLGDRWDEVCSLIIVGHKCLDGEFELKDGTKFAIYSTAYGDGVYQDQHGHAYPVDSGSIGCVLVSDITSGEMSDSGNIIKFDHSFSTYGEDGIIQIGDIVIDTVGEDYTEDEYDEDEYDEYLDDNELPD